MKNKLQDGDRVLMNGQTGWIKAFPNGELWQDDGKDWVCFVMLGEKHGTFAKLSELELV